ncbi:M23 family metallopeptidase [Brachybacterium sp.]|uniref:M23 family metallopeptidase n=1 Tax=Brachybacterium sp. TaxID=1891286 RepID=UPI002ED014DB
MQNSPAHQVPSHGTSRLALDHAIDLVPVDDRGRSAPLRPRSLLTPEPPEAFPGFGWEVRSPLDGVVTAVHDGEVDHAAHRGLPSIVYSLTQGTRVAEGWRAVAGNHVILRCRHGGDEVFVALCHLQRGSVTVGPGERVATGDVLARCGNSGNSTEPHLHLQAMTSADPTRARAVAITFPDGLPRNGEFVGVC